jgi:opacity protein-like surface antigen
VKNLNRFFAVFVFVMAVTLFPFNTAPAQFGGYMGVFGGYTVSPDASRWDNDYYYGYTDRHDLDVEETWVLGFKLGYTPPQLVFASFEFEYSYLNPDMDSTIWTYPGRNYAKIEGEAEFSNFMFNAIVKYPAGKIHPYVGGGLGFSYVDVSVSESPAAGYGEYDDTVFAWQILLGVDIMLSNNLSMDIGYRFFATESDDDHYDYHDFEDSHLDYETSIVTFGLTYRF